MKNTNTPLKVTKKPQFEFLNHEDIEKLYHHYTLLSTESETTTTTTTTSSNSNGVSVSHLLSLPGAKENPLAKRIMECFDENGDGTVDFEEFINGLAVFSARGSKADKIKFAFDVYDIDRDGYISNGELFLALKIMSGDHLEDNHLQEVVDKTIRDADLDGDGRISLEEFTKVIETRNSQVLDKWSLTDL